MSETLEIQFPEHIAEELKKALDLIKGQTIAQRIKVWKSKVAVINIEDLGFKAGDTLLAVHLGKGFWLLFKEDYIK